MERHIQHEPLIRFHHLGIWNDFISSYAERFDKKPWEMTDLEYDLVVDFVHEFAKRNLDCDVLARDYFEGASLDDGTLKSRFQYYFDHTGPGRESYEAVLKGRTNFFMWIVDVAFLGKDYPIKLTKNPDGYCMSCAIGKHCKKTIFRWFRNDLVYRKVLGADFITPEKLFDAKFCRNVYLEESKKYNSWFEIF